MEDTECAALADWDRRRAESCREYEAFVADLKRLNDPSVVEAYENDGDRESCYLSTLWVAFVLWLTGKNEWDGGKGKLALPPREGE